MNLKLKLENKIKLIHVYYAATFSQIFKLCKLISLHPMILKCSCVIIAAKFFWLRKPIKNMNVEPRNKTKMMTVSPLYALPEDSKEDRDSWQLTCQTLAILQGFAASSNDVNSNIFLGNSLKYFLTKFSIFLLPTAT